MAAAISYMRNHRKDENSGQRTADARDLSVLEMVMDGLAYLLHLTLRNREELLHPIGVQRLARQVLDSLDPDQPFDCCQFIRRGEPLDRDRLAHVAVQEAVERAQLLARGDLDPEERHARVFRVEIEHRV